VASFERFFREAADLDADMRMGPRPDARGRCAKARSIAWQPASGVAEIHHAYLVHGPDGEEHYGEVVVTGSDESPDALGQRVATRTA